MVKKSVINRTSGGGRPYFHDVTDEAISLVNSSGIKEGALVVSTHHTTCSIMIQERSFDRTYTGLEFLQQDLWDVMEKIIPTCRREGQYMHPGPELTEFSARHGEDKPETLNTDAHLRSALIGRSESIVISDGKLDLGSFGRIYFVDFDTTRGRTRDINLLVIGE